MKTIKVSEIKNLQNSIYDSNGECSGERILYLIKNLQKGRKPTFYTYNNEKVIIDITQNDIEEIAYCDCCGYQTTDLDAECPIHGEFRCEGYRLKGKQHNIYSDSDWNRLTQEFKDKFKNNLDRFKEN